MLHLAGFQQKCGQGTQTPVFGMRGLCPSLLDEWDVFRTGLGLAPAARGLNRIRETVAGPL